MSHRISQNLKGALGEIFVKNEFSEFELLDPPEPIKGFEDPPKVKLVYPEGREYIDITSNEYILWDEKRYNKIIEKYGTATFPDYKIKGTKIFIEVKTGSSAKLEKNQLEEFPKIIEKGFRIFVVRPRLLIEKRKFEVVNFYCTEFLGKNKRKRAPITELKQAVKNGLMYKAKGKYNF